MPGDEGYFLFISVYDHTSDTLSVQLATSRDGRHYKRLCREPFLPLGETFDCGRAVMCPGIHVVGDDLVMMYHAVEYDHGEPASNIHHAGSYAVLRFPPDRFQGLHARESFECSVPVERTGDGSLAVTLNATVYPGGQILGGILPAKGEQTYLPGFSPTDCVPATGDGIRLSLRWKGGAVPQYPMSEPLELRLLLRNATLFSYTC